MDKDYNNYRNIEWNFTKFLFLNDWDGNIVDRFEPTVPMKTVKKSVEAPALKTSSGSEDRYS